MSITFILSYFIVFYHLHHHYTGTLSLSMTTIGTWPQRHRYKTTEVNKQCKSYFNSSLLLYAFLLPLFPAMLSMNNQAVRNCIPSCFNVAQRTVHPVVFQEFISNQGHYKYVMKHSAVILCIYCGRSTPLKTIEVNCYRTR